MNDSALNLLGLCRKAGKLSPGHDACKASINQGRASLCLICSDASQRLNEEITALAEKAGVRIFDVDYSMMDIKAAISFKAAVLAIDDEGFAKSLIKKINENESGKERGL